MERRGVMEEWGSAGYRALSLSLSRRREERREERKKEEREKKEKREGER